MILTERGISTVSGLIIIIAFSLVAFSTVFIYEKISLMNVENVKIMLLDETSDWPTYTDAQNGFELKYPLFLIPDNNTPSSTIIDCSAPNFPSQCPNSEDVQQKLRDFNPNTQPLKFAPYPSTDDIKFCEAVVSEGAAGTSYKNYFYLTKKDNKCIVVKITTAYPNCQNYLPLKPGNRDQEVLYNNCVQTNRKKPSVLREVMSTFKFTR
jgi:hypothetical protein